ncbi:arachidonate 15-lipoxygenase precursor [Grosmannia clavigera kw1407]|uniref:Manganese lipoxygenase n=1 Tax=Grosmannia clavigera (strain kw1407 / UAMH 11150) TaxID=655863 RepID=F0XJJ7_GROCL|nr:arachidonate 15-lipoxygenase precursor [Grosmannia clavigera kw1407]EFX02092.1 arachidonate 15-lipoxygenase precursor [Grosmannia clavigera kw1407]
MSLDVPGSPLGAIPGLPEKSAPQYEEDSEFEYTIDDSVFDNEAINLGLFSPPISHVPKLRVPNKLFRGPQDGPDSDSDSGDSSSDSNLVEGTSPKEYKRLETGSYEQTSALLNLTYSRVEKLYEAYFHANQTQPLFPYRRTIVEQKKIYQWTSSPDQDPNEKYPPHLQTIPKPDQESLWAIFNIFGLAQTGIMLKCVIPDQIVKFAGALKDISEVPKTIAGYEDFNKTHIKGGNNVVEKGKNLGQLEDWFTDRRFAEQSFTGANPTTIEAIGEHDDAKEALLKEFIASAEKNGYDKWAAMLKTIPHDSLFVQDCRYFREAIGLQPEEDIFYEEVRTNPKQESDPNWACASVTLFQLHDNGRLHPIAIVCDYKKNMATSVTIFNSAMTPADPESKDAEEKSKDLLRQKNDWPWRYAKTCAQAADWIRHEVGVHLTRAHMIEESLIVATSRCIPTDHPVHQLLKPHWVRTLSLNAAARSMLVPQVVLNLVGISLDGLYNYINYEYSNFDYEQNYVPNDLKRRGFPTDTKELNSNPKYKNYAYGKNILLMWNVLRTYVHDTLALTYKSDAHVKSDNYLSDWGNDIRTNGKLKGFPEIDTLDRLTDAVTMAIHIAAPFHTAVNYLQNYYQSFVITKPSSLCAAPPKTLAELKEYTEQTLTAALPIGRIRQWLLSVQLPWLLSFKVEDLHSLMKFSSSHVAMSRGERKKINIKLHQQLLELDTVFKKNSDEMDEGHIEYTVMNPKNMAVSILI